MKLLTFFSCLSVGLLVGALLFEAVVLAPYWQSLSPKRFGELHAVIGPRLYRFFAPITAAATSISATTAIVALLTSNNAKLATSGTALCLLVMVWLYVVYFAKANARLAAAADHPETLDPNHLSTELTRRAQIHRIRVGVGLIGYTCSIYAFIA